MALDPSFDAFSVEAVLASGQENAAIIALELTQTDRTSPTHVLTLLPHFLKGFTHPHDLVTLSFLQVLTGRK